MAALPAKSKAKDGVNMVDGEKIYARLIDTLGRVEIPTDIRKVLGWDPDTRLEIGLVDISVKSIILREVSTRCSLCRRKSENLAEVEMGCICPECAVQI